MSKRTLDLFSPSSTPPSKRARFDPGTSSPVRRHTRVSPSDSSPYTRYSFPSSASGASTPYSVPSDSPSNPFGLERALLALKLPRPLGFAKHLPLRFQLVYDPPRHDTKGKGKGRAGHNGHIGVLDKDSNVARALAERLVNVYRVSQVPTNYTFRHLHKIILWLFASDARWERPPGTRLPSRHRRSSRLKEHKTQPHVAPHRAECTQDLKGKGRQIDVNNPAVRPRAAMGVDVSPGWAGHVFEVRDDIQLYNSGYRPGAIKRNAGRVRIRLSSERDRKLFPDLYGDDDWLGECSYASYAASTSGAWGEGRESDAISVPESGFEEDADDDSADDVEGKGRGEKEWVWEAEDDYTVGHVWPDGPKLSQGIVYHHIPGVSVHITIDTHKLSPRKGIGNQPFVFRWKGSARGTVRIAHLSQTPSTSDAAPAPFACLSREVFEDETDTEERRLRRWNSPDAFTRFLEREEERECALRRQRTTSLPSRFTDTALSSPPSPRPENADVHSLLPPSSPPRYSSSPMRPGRTRFSSPLAFPSLGSPHTSPSRSRSSPGRYALTSPRARARTLSYPLSSPGTLGVFPLMTPFPAHPLLAKRVRRASRRFSRITRSGLKEMGSSEEEAGSKKGKKVRKGSRGGGGEGGGGEVLVADSDVGETADDGDAGGDWDGDALFAEDTLDDGDVGDLQSDDFWREMGGLGDGFPQWIGQGREEDWDPYAEAEL